MNMKMLGSILLIGGTAIGAGMLALPVLTAEAGFFPSSLLFIAIWAFTLFTALLIVEVNLSFEGEVNLISMTKTILGKRAATLCWIFFLLLLYSLTSAYLSGSGSIISEFVRVNFGFTIPAPFEPIIPLTLFGLFVMAGTHAVDQANRLFAAGLIITYIGLVAAALPEVMSSRFTIQNYGLLFAAVPVAVTSFGFHIVIPTVVSYLEHNVKLIKKAVIMGSVIPLFVYLLWQFVILGVIPLEKARGALAEGAPITKALSDVVGAPWIVGFGVAFSFFAIVTSFLGVSLALFSFLKDGFQRKSKSIIFLTFLPPLVFVELFPHGFIKALQYAGVIVALISGILPAAMAYQARRVGRATPYRVAGGNGSLLFAILLSLLIIISDIIAA